ncbi:discoidin domain-containing protein [Bosea sp. Root670]|uniref:discoidin domain-containing protein n=1 Tax=Bosea sp. Root670 TaxID=1736583 RepID=UPI000B2754DE|nr:discoidin domain-containing protein [Bosea sp. Root670]
MKTKPIFGARPFGKRDKRILLAAYFDPNGIETIPESIVAWQSLSRHEIVLCNLWPGRAGTLRLPEALRLDDFDGLIIHPTVSYSPTTVADLDAGLERGLAAFEGVKILMKQDEQVMAGLLPELVRGKGFDLVLTCLPPGEQEKVYPRSQIGDCRLTQMLTGYISPKMRQGFSTATRDIDVSYRGSIQALAFGRLGYEKRGIGYDVAAALAGRGEITYDISSRWEDRLSGAAWDNLLARSGVVLGVESGANLFDFDGEVALLCEDYARRHAGEDQASYAYYQRAHEEFLYRNEGNVDYAQISPRHFEAAAAGAAQLLYEGRYSSIFRPHEHFFPLRRDLQDFDAAVDFIRDPIARARMTERAFEEIILEPTYWYESFVTAADDAIDERLATKGRQPAPASRGARRPLAYLLAAHDPTIDPRIGWFAASLAATHEVVVLGTYRFNEVGDGPSLEEGPDGIKLLRVERTRHEAGWLPTARALPHAVSEARALLATLVGYAAAPQAVLAERLGAHVAVEGEILRFRELCGYMVDTNAALLDAIDDLGPPDLVVAADLEALFAAVACGEDNGCPVVFDAHEYWPFSFTDFQHWEIAFWQAVETRLCASTALRIAVTPQLAELMSHEYGRDFASLPNAALRQEGEGLDLEAAFTRRASSARPLVALYQGGFAMGRGLPAIITGWAQTTSNAILVLRGPDNPFRQQMIALAASLGLGEDRVCFPEPVPESELIEAALEADIGLVPYDPAYFGYRYCSPNKLSQYAAAGLPILSSPTAFVADVVQKEGIGFVSDLNDPQIFAGLIDDLAGRRHELVERGRRARSFFDQRFNWNVLAAPIIARIGELPAPAPWHEPDLARFLTLRVASGRDRNVAAVSPTLFGGRTKGQDMLVDVADAEEGASIIACSPHHPRPHDADAILRATRPGAYAAALQDTPMPHWFEVDFSRPRVIDRVEIGWFSPDLLATDYKILSRLGPGDEWTPLVDITRADAVEVRHGFRPVLARFLRVEASAFKGEQQRMLVRSLRAFERNGPPVTPVENVEKAPAEPEKPELIDVASVAAGARVIGSSPFFSAPYDPSAVLGEPGPDIYAAALADTPKPHWFEVDLGCVRALEGIIVEWYDSEHVARSWRIAGRAHAEAGWSLLAEATASEARITALDLDPVEVQFLRLEADSFTGQDRLLLRGFKALTRPMLQ